MNKESKEQEQSIKNIYQFYEKLFSNGASSCDKNKFEYSKDINMPEFSRRTLSNLPLLA